MMLTEQEAREKWCFATKIREVFTSPNPTMESAPAFRCIASACMAWRFLPLPHLPRLVHHAQPPAATVPPERPVNVPPSWLFHPAALGTTAKWVEDDASYEARIGHLQEDREGFCGLAGNPSRSDHA